MIPLRVTATLETGIANPQRPPALDALLAFAQAVYVEGREPVDPRGAVPDVSLDGVLARSACGRYYLASFAQCEVEEWERGRYVNRRFPIGEAQALGATEGKERIGTLSLKGGPAKSFRLPLETAHLRDDVITWWCVGDAGEIRARLAWITHLGKRRGAGLGRVHRWDVEPCEPWGDGYPVIRDARPLRNLPLDAMHPETAQSYEGFGCVSYPYFERDREELCLLSS
jgi:CRISPR type IV-associated protein Csf3